MKQLYALIINRAHFFFLTPGNGIFRKNLSKLLSCCGVGYAIIILCCVLAAPEKCSAQDNNTAVTAASGKGNLKMISGKWKVKGADIKMLVEVDDSLKLKKENCFWADHLKQNIPVVINKNGLIHYSRFGKPVEAGAGIDGNRFVISFNTGTPKVDGSPVPGLSYTVYAMQLTGNEMILSREDGMVSEKYIFERQ